MAALTSKIELTLSDETKEAIDGLSGRIDGLVSALGGRIEPIHSFSMSDADVVTTSLSATIKSEVRVGKKKWINLAVGWDDRPNASVLFHFTSADQVNELIDGLIGVRKAAFGE